MDKDSPDRIPREQMHQQAERLTNKHIQTLGLLQELAKENKTLKEKVRELEEILEKCKDVHNFAEESRAKIKDIQEAYMAHADEINRMLTEKHRAELMQAQEEKFETERELKEQILRMRHEIEALQAANKDLRDTAEEEESNEIELKLKEIQKANETYRKENEELKEELECLRSDMEVYQAKKASDMTQIQDLRKENKQLQQNLQEVQQRASELEFRLDKAMGELEEKSKNQEQATLIENLRDKLRQLSSERDKWVEQEIQMKEDLLDCHALQEDMKRTNLYLQSELEKLLKEYGLLMQDYERLRKRHMKDQDKQTFRDFVLLKRELNSLKDENEDLKSRKRDGPLMLKDTPPPQPAPVPKKKNSLDGTRTGAKKMLAITLGSDKS